MGQIKHKEGWKPTAYMRLQAQSVHDYIEANKHKKDFICSRDFAPAFARPDGTPYNLDDEIEMRSFINSVSRFRQHDIFRYQREVPGGKRVWSVNPVYVDKTGVVTHIPMRETPKSPLIMGPVAEQPPEDVQIQQQAAAFIEEEMKKVRIDMATVRYKGVSADFTDCSLYQLYTAALTIANTFEELNNTIPIQGFSNQNTRTQDDDSEEDKDQFEFDQTETDHGKPF